MAVLAIFTGKGITKKMYEALRPEVNWEQNPPQGAVFHAASFDDKGDLHVCDVWESADVMNQFVNTKLLPAMKKLNVPAPSVNVYPVHNVNVYPAIDRFRLVKSK